MANIAPIFRKGNKVLAENYRPVSLTCITCKLFEHIVCRQILDHVEDHKILTNLQHGFRSGRSCETLSNAKDIANAFNVYFANIGKNLASEIEQNVNIIDYTQYLSTPRTETRLQFKCVTDNDTQKAIDKLENKSSSEHDGISNKLLKLLKMELSKSLTLIINQMITTGIFPDSSNIQNNSSI